MRCPLISTRVFAFVLLTVAGSAFAQTTAKVSINDVTVVEGTTQGSQVPNYARFTLSLTSSFSTPMSVAVVVHDQSAKNGVDYLWSGGYVYFNPKQQSTTLSIPIVGDNLPEGDETFTVELLPQYPILAGRTIGVCTILDDDGAVSPPYQRIAEGDKGVIHIRLTDPATANEQVLLQASDPTLLMVPGSMTIASGASGADAEFVGLKTGAASILATLPPSRGGRTYELSVTVHDATALAFDPIQLNLSLGTPGTVTVQIDPPPAAPVRLLIQAVKSGVVDVPDTLLTGADGRAAIPVRSTGLGSTTVNVALPDINGGASAVFGVTVTLGPGPVVTSVAPALGRASGGESVQIKGYNFSDHCSISFGGAPVPYGHAQLGGNAMTLLTPPHDAGAVDISIRCDGRSFTFANAFAYQPSPAKLTAVFPKSGTTRGGTVVSIIGVDFRFDSCSARFGQTLASPVWTQGSTTSIGVLSPPHDAGGVDVSLVCGSDTVTLPGAFNYVSTDDPPASLSQIFGLKQGTIAEMDGSAFRGDDEILINGVAWPDITTPSSGRHLFTLPEITGQAAVTLRDYAGRELTRTVTIAPPDIPIVTKLPDRLTLGAEFTVAGAGLRGGLTYMLGPAPVQIIPNPVINSFDRSICGAACPPTQAVFRTPISVGPGTTTFTIADRGTVVVTKSVEVTTSGPVVSAITPLCAAFDGGSLVTISGSGFNDGAAVQFGTTFSIDVLVKNPFTILARLPPSFGIAQPQITVFNPDGSAATLTDAFTYRSAGDPRCGGGRHRAAGQR
ncbi:MAG TPA: IPT/TIG domain-containing protein [Thermoanaerobaculia bacterium]|nr:IPT/TIG domain-containing protein [Thermoanaerobaculia bacterium]